MVWATDQLHRCRDGRVAWLLLTLVEGEEAVSVKSMGLSRVDKPDGGVRRQARRFRRYIAECWHVHKSQRLWVALGTHDLAFNRNSQLAACIDALTFEEIQLYAHKLARREHCGELILYASGKFEDLETPEERTVRSISEFKAQVPYY